MREKHEIANVLVGVFVDEVLSGAKAHGFERHEIGMLFQACTEAMMKFLVDEYGAEPTRAVSFADFAIKKAIEKFAKPTSVQ